MAIVATQLGVFDSGTVLGGTVHLWKGNTEHEGFEHEVYHSYQYMGWGDLFIPD